MPDSAHIASIVVQATPDNVASITEAINKIKGTEIHAKGDNGKLVVVLEVPDLQLLTDKISKIQAIPNVVNALLIYHHIDEPENEFGTLVNKSLNEEKILPC